MDHSKIKIKNLASILKDIWDTVDKDNSINSQTESIKEVFIGFY